MDWNQSTQIVKTIKSDDSPQQKLSTLLSFILDNKRGDNTYIPKVRFSKLPV